jgi:acetoin utilization deacetylase AcuC-like enzyme
MQFNSLCCGRSQKEDDMSIGIVRHEIYLKHETDEYHPENPNRLRRIYAMLDDMGDEGITYVPPRWATMEEIALNHESSYIASIMATQDKPSRRLDPDTSTSPKSYEAACMAVGGVLELSDRLMASEVRSGFALVRPPGHHAERDRAMGFCIFNNVAVGARYLAAKYGVKRILLIDWDLHHGNGTQHSFYRDPGVLYFSTHQYPYYPGTGHYEEIGEGEGKGYTVNVPLSYGMGDTDYIYVFSEVLLPLANRYKPEFILVSAGFDTHRDDPLGGMAVTEKGFAEMTRMILAVAEEHCKNKVLFALEGGYDLNGLTDSVQAVITEQKKEAIPPAQTAVRPTSEIVRVITRVKDVLKPYWEAL